MYNYCSNLANLKFLVEPLGFYMMDYKKLN